MLRLDHIISLSSLLSEPSPSYPKGLMKLSKSVVSYKTFSFLSLVLFTLSFSPVYATSVDDLEAYASRCDTPYAPIGPEEMSAAMGDPKKFASLMAQLRQPATAKSMMQCMFNSDQRGNMCSRLMNPLKMMQIMMSFMNPKNCLSWMNASTQPQNR